MSRHPRRDTEPELALRRALHAAGYRFRVCLPVPGMSRRSIDIAFTRKRIAVFVDGCFWHDCPEHGELPRANQEWWREKLSRNTERDAQTTSHLSAQGWTVLRLWEHTPVGEMVDQIVRAVRLTDAPSWPRPTERCSASSAPRGSRTQARS